MRAIGRYCEVRIAGAAASKSPPTIVAPATSDATLVATPQCDVRQSLPLLAVPDGPTYLHIHESALSIDAPHGPIPHSTPSICNTDTDVAPTGLIDQSNDSERAERPV
ncbi:hypothetical protein BD309DRAFT_655221 [Dichomitus squalens]|nr:hypothetical protein BD309DRAFT_655221 [Dichomitus squalens]TBU62529.1 hypothetical protein BD310DRAFT_55526 [Dichomitus squalens]